MHEIIQTEFKYSDKETNDYINERLTDDGGYRDRLHNIITLFSEFFYMGTRDLDRMDFEFSPV